MRPRRMLPLRLSIFLALFYGASACADESEDASRITLADLPHYQRALAGRATVDSAKASDPAIKVSFKELWEKTGVMRGRRITVLGRVERIFRQGPVGSLPALAEVWISSPSSDPFCLIFAHGIEPDQTAGNSQGPTVTNPSQPIPSPGQAVRFTGTFLKMVRYTASDGARLAPLIVGDRPPFAVSESDLRASASARTGKRATGASHRADSLSHPGWSPETYAVGAIVIGLVISVLTWQHLRPPPHCALRDSGVANTGVVPELRLEFMDHPDGPSTSVTS
jgi:hypothetical protein